MLLLTHYGLFVCHVGNKLVEVKHLLSRLWSDHALPSVVIPKATRRSQFLAAIIIALICPKKGLLCKLTILCGLFAAKSSILISVDSA